jgi:hypothetical protein
METVVANQQMIREAMKLPLERAERLKMAMQLNKLRRSNEPPHQPASEDTEVSMLDRLAKVVTLWTHL